MTSFRFALPLPLLAALACSGPKGEELFAQTSIPSAAAGAQGGSAAAVAGTDSATDPNRPQGDTSAALAGSGSNAGTGSGGSASGAGGTGGTAPTEQPHGIESCDMLDGAVVNDENGHCYRINTADLSFADARDACVAGAGHLVTISSKTEDAFVHALAGDSHWLGASDGRANNMEGVGSYSWVNGDDWDYTRWEGGQPNAVATDCPSQSGGAKCFEHCAYQDDSGGWNDRACWHTIPSVCEWELPTP